MSAWPMRCGMPVTSACARTAGEGSCTAEGAQSALGEMPTAKRPGAPARAKSLPHRDNAVSPSRDASEKRRGRERERKETTSQRNTQNEDDERGSKKDRGSEARDGQG